jgi:hypothetical protein
MATSGTSPALYTLAASPTGRWCFYLCSLYLRRCRTLCHKSSECSV